MSIQSALIKLANAFITEVMQNLSSGYPSGADLDGRDYATIEDTIERGNPDVSKGEIEVFIGNDKAPYAKPFEFGSGEHVGRGTYPIRPKDAEALSFYWERIGAQTIVPKGGGFKSHWQGNLFIIGKGQVDHPGIEAKPYIKPVADDFNPAINKALTRDEIKKLFFENKPQQEVWK